MRRRTPGAFQPARSAVRTAVTVAATTCCLAAAPAGRAQGAGDAPSPPPACADADCVVDTARALLDAGRAPDAVAYLRPEVDRFPRAGAVQRLLGAAQLAAGQPLWAIDTFARRLDEAPDDCEARAWLAWSWLQFAAVEEALAVLDDERCTAADPWAARLALVRAYALRAAGDDDAARTALAEADRRDEMLAADRPALAALERALHPDRLPELRWRVDLLAGFSTNPLLGAPADPRLAAEDTRSGVTGLEAFLGLAPDFHFPLRPLLEFQPKLEYYLGRPTADQSYLDLSGRVGLVLDWEMPRLLVAYRPGYLMLFDDDRYGSGPTSSTDPYWVEPLWYYAAHRVEVEAEIRPWLLVFAGAGRREFYELGRSRTEFDGGFGGSTPLGERLTLLWTLTARGQWAADPAYDVGGVSGGLNLAVRLPAGWSGRLGVTVAADWYPESAGAEAFGGNDEARTDLLARAGIAVWSARFWGLRAGLSCDHSSRASTLPEFDFQDFRLLFKLTWTGDHLLTAPSAGPTRATADIPWEADAEDSGLVERVQDLLRQEEQVFRSCGCAE